VNVTGKLIGGLGAELDWARSKRPFAEVVHGISSRDESREPLKNGYNHSYRDDHKMSESPDSKKVGAPSCARRLSPSTIAYSTNCGGPSASSAADRL